jgi:hypothetical protein
MLDDVQHATRHLPPGHAKRMAQLESGPLEVDGRSQRWVDELFELGFIEREFTEYNKSKIAITVKLTERGRYALSRDLRGVDPYLVMT